MSREVEIQFFAKNVPDNLQPPKCLSIPYIFLCGCKVSNMDEQLVKKKNLFEQLPFLKSLKLDGMPRVKWLKNKFSGNDKYHAFPLLEKWFEAEVVAEDGCVFPCLIEWVLSYFLKLKELPSLPSKLKRLRIYEIEWTTLNFCSS
ncbi:hypothetical protein IEQ34_007416 [Dendrobium chrysotoxum]|uniref:Disease resistance protein n=1 Tax=Dendrobium chrysotoxum TaxID=161865 RepID=A0AAV7HAT8_DENCH|nr:hypothetical protein IEQ34_007416 [Dendrobium chrysotoxum]